MIQFLSSTVWITFDVLVLVVVVVWVLLQIKKKKITLSTQLNNWMTLLAWRERGENLFIIGVSQIKYNLIVYNFS